MTFDAKGAVIYAGDQVIKFNDLKLHDSALVVSFNEKYRKVRPHYKNEPDSQILKRLPKIIDVNEVHTTPIVKEEEAEKDKNDESVAVKKKFIYFLCILPLLLIIILALPYIYHRILLSKINSTKVLPKKANYQYKHLIFLLNQLGMDREELTPLNFAKFKIDPAFGTQTHEFITCYLKIKYSTEELTDKDKKIIQNFYPKTNHIILSQFKSKQKIFGFLSISRWMYFLIHLNNKKH